jgi:hypothetical protein
MQAQVLGVSADSALRLPRQAAFPRDSSPGMLIQSQNQPIENKQDKGLSSVKRGQVQPNPQKIRKQNGGK